MREIKEKVPHHYQQVDLGENKPDVLYDLMGLGKRFAYKTQKKDETTPGPGMYSNTAMDTIEKNIERSMLNRSTNAQAGFGASR